MAEPGAAPRKVVTVDVAGPLGLFLGLILGQILLSIVVSVPGILTLVVAGELGAGPLDVYYATFVSAGVGAVACAAIGALLGKRREATWWFIAGVAGVSVYALARVVLAGGPVSAAAILIAVPNAVAAAALALGYRSGRLKRAAIEAAAAHSESVA